MGGGKTEFWISYFFLSLFLPFAFSFRCVVYFIADKVIRIKTIEGAEIDRFLLCPVLVSTSFSSL